jgi:cell division control protein 6
LTVFSDKGKLSPRYIPKLLLHREEQLNALERLFSAHDLSRTYLTPVQLVGGVGTGKTCTAVRFAEQLTERVKSVVNLKHVYINLKLQGGSRVVLYRYLVEKAAPDAYSESMSAEELIRSLVNELVRNRRYLLITVDEVDYFVRHTKEHLVYDLTRLNELSPGETSAVVGIIFIAKGRDYFNYLERAEVSTLGRYAIDFPTYTASQIYDIIEKRAEESLKRGAISDEALRYIADLTAEQPVNGDIRHALDLLLYSGNLADNRGSERIELDHVRRVHGETQHTITSEDLLNLPEEEMYVLMAAIRALQIKKAPYVTLKDIRSSLQILCEERKLKPLYDVEERLQDLHDRGIIEVASLTRVGISGAPAEQLEVFLEAIIRRVEEAPKDKSMA